MKASNAAGSAQANAIIALLNSGLINIYTGVPPANPDTGATGTLLVQNTFAATMGTQTNGVITAAAITSGTAIATGVPGYARLLNSAGTAAYFDLVFATAWGQSLAYAAGQICFVGSNFYIATTGGTSAATGTGPSGTGTGIVDGTVVWSYGGTTAAAAGADISEAATLIAAGSIFSTSSMTITVPVH